MEGNICTRPLCRPFRKQIVLLTSSTAYTLQFIHVIHRVIHTGSALKIKKMISCAEYFSFVLFGLVWFWLFFSFFILLFLNFIFRCFFLLSNFILYFTCLLLKYRSLELISHTLFYYPIDNFFSSHVCF